MSTEDGAVSGHTKTKEEKNKDEFYKDKLEELEKENRQLKSMKDSLQHNLNFLMRKIRHIKLARSEDLTDEDSAEAGGIRFSIAESNGLSSRCYTALFDSFEDLSVNEANDDFRLSALARLSSDGSDSYTELNAYSPCDQPPQVRIVRKRILSPSHDVTQSFGHLSHPNEPILLPEDLKGSVLSPEIVIKSPRRYNKSRTRIADYSHISQPTSPDAVCRTADNVVYSTINIPETPPSSQASPMDIIRSYHSSNDRQPAVLRTGHDYTENPYCQILNPISELIQYLPFYTCVRGVPRLAKVTACKVASAPNFPSGSSSSFEIGESALNPFSVDHKISAISPLDFEDPPVEVNTMENECESNVSMEYCFPPEEGSTFSNNRSPEQSHHPGAAPKAVSQGDQEKQVIKRGVLRKLNKNFKLWSNFFCVLTNKGLFFYNVKCQPHPEDLLVVQKPVKVISVDIMTKIELIRDEKTPQTDFCLGSFEVIVGKHNKSYTLATGDKNQSKEWIKALRNVLLQHQSSVVMRANSNQLLHRGWVTRVKWGYSKKLWCCLAGKYLVYFNGKDDYFPTGCRNLANSTINTNTSVCRTSHTEGNSRTSEISDSFDYPDVFFTISICQQHCTPIFLCVDTEQELHTWSHYLRMSVRNVSEAGKSVDVADLTRPDYQDHFWYTSGDLYQPVCVHTSPALTTGAVQIWKALERLASVEHFSCRKEHLREKFDRISFLTQICTQEPGLKDELYLQLMKQTSSAVHKDYKTGQSKRSKFSLFCGGDTLISSSSSIHDHRLKTTRDTEYNATLSMWECLAILIPIFLPSPSVLTVLRKYLLLSKEIVLEPENQVQKYASYCLDELDNVREVSGRVRPPSLFEVTAMSMRNPYTHSLPFSLPVYVHSENYHVVSFSSLSSIAAIHDSMLQAIFSPDSLLSLLDVCQFALYLYQPHGLVEYTFLSPDSKICDVISKFEDHVTSKKLKPTSDDPLGGIKFFFRIQAFKYDLHRPLCPDLLKMLCLQMHCHVKTGHYSLSGSQMLVLISLLFDAHRLENADFWHTERTMTQFVMDLFPASLTRSQTSVEEMKSLLLVRLKPHVPDVSSSSSSSNSSSEIYLQYLRYLREMCDFQCSPATVICVATHNSDCLSGQQLIVVCQDTAISFLDQKCRICLKKIPLSDILSFGCTSQHFLIAYSLLPTKKCFKRIILHLPDYCASLELINSIVFYLNRPKSQDS